MANITLPFSKENKVDDHDTGLSHDDLYERLSPPLKKATESNPYLLEYLHMVPISQVGVPEYYPELSRKMGDIKEPNLIYPVKNEGVFIHILFDEEKDRTHYIPVEPTLTLNVDSMVSEV